MKTIYNLETYCAVELTGLDRYKIVICVEAYYGSQVSDRCPVLGKLDLAVRTNVREWNCINFPSGKHVRAINTPSNPTFI